jgi:NAD(P)-dependent dehydrogenase (short-subunit alcohol dehydrogenase family)
MLGIDKGRPGKPGDAIIVTGSGTGIGLETSLHLAERGFRVYATVRDGGQRDELLKAAADRGVQMEVLRLDLTDRSSIEEALQTVLSQAGGVYGLVNNGGIGLRGCTEDCSEEEIRKLFETNVLGTIAVTKAVIPHMRDAGCGRIVTISSVGGRVVGFGVTMYCASKFAQEALGEGLAQELAPFGIQSILVEPGMLKTTRWDRYRGAAAGSANPNSPYHGLFTANEEIADGLVRRSGIQPQDVAATIATALTDSRPRMRYVVGRGARVVIALRRHLPQGFFERVYFGGHLRRLTRRAAAPDPSPATAETGS